MTLGPYLGADALIDSFKAASTDSWSDKREYLLREAFIALLHIPRATLLDLAYLLRKGCKDSNELRTTHWFGKAGKQTARD